MFALMHSMNPEVAKYGLGTMMFYYFRRDLLAILLLVMTIASNWLRGHADNNTLGATLVTYSGSVLQTDTLFLAQERRDHGL
ncbi:MAG: hypothetical protein IPK25_14470 [Saprospiraceae bacterium]|nr:hypothetical protein [Saprospiraceae bacterium]